MRTTVQFVQVEEWSQQMVPRNPTSTQAESQTKIENGTGWTFDEYSIEVGAN